LRSGLCPKCRTPTVYRKWDGIYQGTARVYVNTGGWATTPSHVDCYVCTRCGYFEQYVADDRKMAEVTAAWEKVAPRAPAPDRGDARTSDSTED
jgi:predicted nucleic-acid-binding Zn-ribbon protein